MKTKSPPTAEEKRVQKVNFAFNELSRDLKWFRRACHKAKSPIRSVTFRVLDDGSTKMRVTYLRK